MAYTETQVSNFKIYQLPQEVYDALVQSGGIDETAQYLTTNDDPYGSIVVSNTVVPVSSWAEDVFSETYPYAASVALTGVTSDMVPEIVFSIEDTISGNFAPVAQSLNGGITIYAQAIPEADITVPTIIMWRVNECLSRTTTILEEKQDKRITVSSIKVAVSAWSADSTYTDYPFAATITVSGADSSCVGEVVFGAADATGGNFAPVATTLAGGVKIFAKSIPADTITVATVTVWR